MLSKTHIVEITSACDLRCPYCIVNNGMTRQRRHMPVDDVMRVLAEIRVLGAGQIVYLFNYGEPMLHPCVDEIVGACRDWGIRTKISTNGALIATRGPEVVRRGLDMLMVDLDGVSAPSHSKYRVGSNVEMVMDGIRSMMHQLHDEQTHCRIVIQTIVHRYNEHERDHIRAFARDVGIRYVAWKALALDLGVKLSGCDFSKAYRDLVVSGGEFDRYAGLLRRQTGRPCPFAAMNGAVLSNGDYVVCTHDADGEMVLGNVFREGYLALREKVLADLRAAIGSKALSICQSCSMSTNLGYVEDLLQDSVYPGTVNFSAFDE